MLARMVDKAEAVSGAVVGGAAAAVTAAGGTELAMLAGAGAPAAQAILTPHLRRWGEWLEELAARGARDGDVESLTTHLEGRPDAAALLVDAAHASARTTYEHKLEVIGQAMADGVLYETGTAFDAEAHTVRTIARLERLHVAVLQRLNEQEIDRSELGAAFPNVSMALPGLVGELLQLGVVEEGPQAHVPGVITLGKLRTTALGREVMRRFRVAPQALITSPARHVDEH